MWHSENVLEKLLLRQAFHDGAGGIYTGFTKLEKRLKKELLLLPNGFFSHCDSWIVLTWQKVCFSVVYEWELGPSDRGFPIIFLFLSLLFLCLLISSFILSFFPSFFCFPSATCHTRTFVLLLVLVLVLEHLYYRKFPLHTFHMSGGRLKWEVTREQNGNCWFTQTSAQICETIP